MRNERGTQVGASRRMPLAEPTTCLMTWALLLSVAEACFVFFLLTAAVGLISLAVTAHGAAEARKNNTGPAVERKGALRRAGPLVFQADYFSSLALM